MNLRFWESANQKTLREQEERLQIAQTKAAASLVEASYASRDIWSMMVDPNEAVGDGWMPINLADDKLNLTSVNLTTIRNFARYLYRTNGIAAAALDYRRDHIIGDEGMQYELIPRTGAENSETLREKVKDSMWVWDAFVDTNQFGVREKEIWLRSDRDGETYLRYFDSARSLTGELTAKVPGLRFIEPAQLLAEDSSISTGIEFESGDAEVPKTYYIDKVPVSADKIYRFKHTTDMNVARGLPICYKVFHNLQRVDKLLHNTSVVAQIQSAIALIRKRKGAGKDAVTRLLNTAADEQNSTSAAQGSNGSGRQLRLKAGTIIDAPAGTEYEAPISQVSVEKFVQVAIFDLYAIAASLKVPIYALLSFYDGASGSLPMITEPPRSHYRQLKGSYVMSVAKPIFTRVMKPMFSDDEWSSLSLVIRGPAGVVIDELEDARTREIEIRNGVLSPQTWAAEKGRDYWYEHENRAEVEDNKLDEEKLPWTVLQGQNSRNQESPDGVTGSDGDLKNNENGSTNRKIGDGK